MDNVQLLRELNKNVDIIKPEIIKSELPTLDIKQQNYESFQNNLPNNLTKKSSTSSFSYNLKLSVLLLLTFILLSMENFNTFLLQYMNGFLSILLRGILFVSLILLLLFIL